MSIEYASTFIEIWSNKQFEFEFTTYTRTYLHDVSVPFRAVADATITITLVNSLNGYMPWPPSCSCLIVLIYGTLESQGHHMAVRELSAIMNVLALLHCTSCHQFNYHSFTTRAVYSIFNFKVMCPSLQNILLRHI